MSYEAWGEPEDSPFDAAIEAGWIDPTDLSKAVIDVMNERDRQWNKEGFTPEHDDSHTEAELALAAGSYCESAARPNLLRRVAGAAFTVPRLWPRGWSLDWWKPKNPRADLVRAAALIIAEIERIDRAEDRAKAGGEA
ncbi:Uncharacterised protein [Starkeya nomas]|uniref:Uncharacterized protein n=1 Tax=Starkeya nomas TaxID=2666134 RepID=A0A5S9NZ76_9HYPH|nr:hypothetical protein [Starkeya nomas]CAA0096132.1 Uncharacterised protein [Starkeya nomas]